MASVQLGLGLVVFASIAGCSSDEPPPPVVVALDGDLQAVHADAGHLYVRLTTDAGVAGLYRVPLVDPTGPELLAAGGVLHTRITDGAIVALMQAGRLVTIPLDGSAITEVAVDPTTMATASADGTTYAIERHDDAVFRTRIVTLATETVPPRVVLEANESYGYSNQLLTDGADLYWISGGANHLRVATDGSETQPTYLWESADWESLVLEGQVERSDDWMLGVIDGEPFALRNYESFFATGGEFSNGDPKGYQGFGGGALYTVGIDTEAQPTISSDARLVRGDIRVATFQENTLLAQLLDGDIVTVDAATGTTTPLTRTPHELRGSTGLITNGTSVFYDYLDGAHLVIFGIDLENH